MPYDINQPDDLPEHVQKLPAKKRRQWVKVFNQIFSDEGDEGRAMAGANAAVKEPAAKAADDTGAMIALYIPTDIGQRLALPGGEPVSELHLTLAYLGDEVENPERLKQFVAEFSATHYLQPARIGGIGRFNRVNSDGNQAVYATVDSPNLPGFRQELVSGAEWAADVEPSKEYGFVPHVTLAYVPVDAPMPIQNIEPLEFQFKRISLTIGPERFDYDLVTEAEYINTAVTSMGMSKSGARNSQVDMKRIQGAHDLMCELGAKCAERSNMVYPPAEQAPTQKAGTPDDYLVVEDNEKPSTWHLRVRRGGKPDHGLMGAAWAALHSGFRGNVYEGPGKNEAIRKLRKLYEAEEMTPPGEDKEEKSTPDALADAQLPGDGSPSTVPANALKAISQTDDQLITGNYIVLFGNPQLRDLEGVVSANKNADGSTGEFFTPATQFDSDYTATGRLMIDWEHGHDPDQADPVLQAPGKDDILGYVDWSTAKSDGNGLWVQRVLNRRNRYVKMLETLINAGLIGTSSDAIPTQVQKAANGEIVTWPLRRDTLTVSPMEPRMMDQNTLQALKALAHEVPAIKVACERLGIDTDKAHVQLGKARAVARLRLKSKLVS